MTEFIENFDQKHSNELTTVKEIETRIFKLLEHISKDLQRQQQLPSKENFQDLQDEVAVKQRGLENSQSTAERLRQEKKNRDAELEKIVNLVSFPLLMCVDGPADLFLAFRIRKSTSS